MRATISAWTGGIELRGFLDRALTESTGGTVSKMRTPVSKAYLFRRSLAPREETNRGAGESICFPKSILQISKVGGGHILGMTDKEHKDRRFGGHLSDECGFRGLGRFSVPYGERMVGQNGLKELV